MVPVDDSYLEKMLFNVYNIGDTLNNMDHNNNNIGYISRMKRPRLITEEGDDKDNTGTMLSGEKRARMKNPGPCFVALITASDLEKDSLCFPHDFTSSSGLKRKSQKIVLTDERGKSWALDLRFDKSSETLNITRGWRNFCDENGKKAGDFFEFRLMKTGDTPFLSFYPTESISDGTQGDENNRESTLANQNRFVTLTLTKDSLKNSRLYLPMPFLKENGMDKPGMVTLLGKDGTRRLVNLLRENSGRMSLGKGLKDFTKANELKMGESFTMELIWETATPVLSLLNTESRSHNRFVTLTLTKDSFKNSRLGLPLPFMRENGMNKPGSITLVGRDGTKWTVNLLRESQGRMSLGKGWKDFVKANGLEIGESFTLESVWEDETPMLRLTFTESNSSRRELREQQGEYYCVEGSEKEYVLAEASEGNGTEKDDNNVEEESNLSSLVQN
ncbi:unnamed protein product [Cochlearia groenlandica]